DAIGRVIGLLRRGVDRRLAGAHVGDRASRPRARMRLGRKLVLAFDVAHRLFDAVLEVAVLALELTLDDRRLADVVVQSVVAGEIRLRLRPGYFQRARG